MAAKNHLLQIGIEPGLIALIDHAVQTTGLSKEEVLKQALRNGIPKIVPAARRTERTLVDALLEMKGLNMPLWHCPGSGKA